MRSLDNITALLRSGQLDATEVSTVLTSHFGSASRGFGDTEVSYGRQGQADSLRIRYVGNRVSDVSVGDGAQDADLSAVEQKITSSLVDDQRVEVGWAVAFSSRPIVKAVDARPVAMMVPVPEQAPKAPFLMAQHPFILEFSYRFSNDFQVAAHRRHTSARRAARLLNALLHDRIELPHHRHTWIYEVVEGAPSAIEARHRQQGYTIPNYVHTLDWSDSTSRELTPQMAADSYYFNWLRHGVGTEFTVPDVAMALARAYSNLSSENADRFDRALHWFDEASGASSASSRLVFLVFAIDTLVPPAKGAPQCDVCGKSRGSATQRFVDFLRPIVPETADYERVLKRLYKVRSRIAHGGDLLRSDVDHGMSLLPDADEDVNTWPTAQLISRIALLEWLAKVGQ